MSPRLVGETERGEGKVSGRRGREKISCKKERKIR